MCRWGWTLTLPLLAAELTQTHLVKTPDRTYRCYTLLYFPRIIIITPDDIWVCKHGSTLASRHLLCCDYVLDSVSFIIFKLGNSKLEARVQRTHPDHQVYFFFLVLNCMIASFELVFCQSQNQDRKGGRDRWNKASNFFFDTFTVHVSCKGNVRGDTTAIRT